VDVEVVEAVAQPRPQGEVRVGGHELRPARIVLRQIVDDDGRFRDRAALGIVAQHRKLADRPDLQERRARSRVAEIDNMRHESRVVLVERDERLLAVR
jgi:hypothetical protein